MKFEYDGVKEDRECVAFIDNDGNLYIKTYNGCIELCHDDMPECHAMSLWDYMIEDASRKFYPGDKITITF